MPVFVRSYGFMQASDDDKVSYRTLSDRQPLRKAPYTARTHTTIVLRIGKSYEHMHYQRFEMHSNQSASRRAGEGSTDG